ncbi:hypothetical protein M758_9G158800, partial [Ceratodon purpureus]
TVATVHGLETNRLWRGPDQEHSQALPQFHVPATNDNHTISLLAVPILPTMSSLNPSSTSSKTLATKPKIRIALTSQQESILHNRTHQNVNLLAQILPPITPPWDSSPNSSPAVISRSAKETYLSVKSPPS